MALYKNKYLIPACILLSTIACSPKKSVEEQLSEAQGLIEQQKNEHAVISLKNILKDAPKTAKARFLLSQIYINTGNIAGANKELDKAIELGLDIQEHAFKLAEMYIEINNSQAAIDLLSSTELDENDNILKYILKGQAYLNLGEIDLAKEAFEVANDINDEAAYSLYGSAVLASMSSEYDRAGKLLDKSLAIQDDIAEAWLLRARIFEKEKNYKESIVAYQNFMRLRPQASSIELLIAENYIKLGELDTAEEIVDRIMALSSQHPSSNLLKARIAGQRKDFVAVKHHAEVALVALPLEPLALYLSGVANFYLKNYEQSYSMLVKVVEDLPKDHQAHKLLMINLVKLGYFEQIDEAITNFSGFDVNDIDLLGDIGTSLYYRGSLSNAAKVLEKIVDLKPESKDEKTKLAVLKLLNKDLTGLADLEHIFSGEDRNRNASFALAVTYFQKQNFSEAINTLNTWLETNNDDIEALLLKAKIFDAQGNSKDSLTTLLLAQQKSSKNPDVLYMIAQNKAKNKELIAAQDKLYEIIEINPQYKKAYSLLLHIKRELNQEGDFLEMIRAMAESDEGELIWPRIILAQYALLKQEYSKAENLLITLANSNLPNAYFSTMMDVYFGKENRVKLNEYAVLWKTSFPNAVLPHLKHVALTEQSGNIEKALELTKLSLTEGHLKDNLQLLILNADYLLRLGKNIEAKAIIKRLNMLSPNNSLIQLLSGQFELMNGDLSKAVEQLGLSYQQRRDNRSLLLLVDAYRKSGFTPKAIKLIENADEGVFKQIPVQTILAEMYLAQEPSKAIATYKALIKSSPNNAFLLNNLAWTLILENDYADAVKYAKLAEQLMPNSSSILDTLGVALMKNEENKAALLVLTKANTHSNAVNIKIHLAMAMHKNNQKEESLALLEQLSGNEKAPYKKELSEVGINL